MNIQHSLLTLIAAAIAIMMIVYRIYTRYAILTIANLLFTLVAYLLNPFVVLFARGDVGNAQLPNWLKWFATFDAPIDAGWLDGYFPFKSDDGTNAPSGFELYWLRVKWLYRNPAYGFCYWVLGRAYDPSEWIIKTLDVDPSNAATLLKLHAVTKDGKAFCYTTSSGWKLGYKLWWAMDELEGFTLLPKMLATHGPANVLPFAFTPRKPW